MKIKQLLFAASYILQSVICSFSFSQNIGINTDGSAAEAGVMLHVKGTTLVANNGLQNIFQVTSLDALPTAQLKLRLGLNTNATTTSRYGVIDVYDAGASVYRNLAIQPSGGNVGIGTTAPTARLHINAGDIGIGRIDGADVTPYARFGLSNGYEQYLANNAFYNSATSQWNYVNPAGYGGMATMMYQLSGVLSFYSANNAANPVAWSQRMTILNNGNIGINQSNPGYKLTVGAGAIGGDYGLTPNYAAWAAYSTGDGGAAIYNDNGSYKKLMIVGNTSAGGVRQVGLWDFLQVNGSMQIIDGTQGAGKVYTSDASGNGSWQPNSGGGCPNPGLITGTATFSAGQTGVAYSIAAVTGATSYAWTVPPGSIITAGQGTTAITVTFGNTVGNICVTCYSAACGSSCPSCKSVSCYVAGTQTFNYTGGLQSWTVPCGVTTVTVTCKGASGGTNNPKGQAGGTGGTETAVFTFSTTWSSGPLIGSNVFYIYVGGAGANANGVSCSVSGGWNGGGIGSGYTSWALYGGGGGGGTDVRLNGGALTDRIIVAGGGAGAGDGAYSNGTGGNGGGSTGGNGATAFYSGSGGSQAGGGASPCAFGTCQGSLGVGGDAACGGGYGGGGGGGGYYGGGAGQSAGGGGGSNYANPTATVLANTQGGNAGNGQVVITW